MDVTLTQALTYINKVTGNVFTTPVITTALKEGYDVFCRATGCLVYDGEPAALQDVASTATYTLPDDLLSVERISYLGRTIYPLRSEQLVLKDNQALLTEGTVIGYLLDGDGVTKLRKYRIPAETDVDSRTHIDYIRKGADLSSTHYEIQPWMVRLTWYYALAKLLRRDGVTQDLKFSDHFQQRYLAGVQRVLRRKSKYQSRRAGVLGGGPTTRGIPIGPRLPWNYGEVVR